MKQFWQLITDQKHWPRFLRKVNVSYRRIQRKEVLTFLLFVAIAAFFWTVQTSREESVSEFVVDLVVVNQPQDMVFTANLPPAKLRVSLSDTNSRLFNYNYNGKFNTLVIDFERYADAMGNFRLSAAELSSLLSDQLMNTTRVVTVNPSLIDARFAQMEGRKFPVKVKGSYLPAENRRLHDIAIVPDSVTINAPSSVFETLQYVYTVDSSFYDLKDTLLLDLPLDLPIGVKATPSHVKVMVPVVEYVEKVFDMVELHVTDVPLSKRLVVFPYAVRITCLVDFANYRDITAEMFEATVSYNDISSFAEASGYLPIKVSYNGPTESVTNISVTPAKAEYVVE